MAGQSHIRHEKDKQIPDNTITDDADVTIEATFSPDEDGIAFRRATTTQKIIGSAIKIETEDSSVISKALPDTLNSDNKSKPLVKAESSPDIKIDQENVKRMNI